MGPIVGLTSLSAYEARARLSKLNFSYIDAISQSGGIPVIIPNLREPSQARAYIDIIDGIVFTGGEDISPLVYGQEPIREVKNISYSRDRLELRLFKRAYNKKIPILGICRGLQLVNIGLGGSLYQDIPRQIPEAIGHFSSYSLSGGYHSIKLVEDSMIYDIFQSKQIRVNSQHHQAIKDLGENLKITGRSRDGLVEVIESTNENFVLGLQFHPEAMINEHEEFKGIFDYFIEGIGKYERKYKNKP